MQKALACAMEMSDTTRWVYALDHLTHLYMLSGLYDSVLYTSEQHLHFLAPDIKLSQTRIVYQRRAKAYERLGKPDKALREINIFRAIAHTQGNAEQVAVSYDLSGTLLMKSNFYPESVAYYDSARALYREQQVGRGVAMTDYNIGMAFFHMARYDSALDFYLKALTYFDAISDYTAVGQVYNMMALLFEKQSFQDLALQYLHEGITRSPPKFRVVAHLTNNLGNIYLKYQDYAKADSVYDVALQLWQMQDDSTEVVRTLLNKVQLGIADGSTVDSVLLKVEQWWPATTAPWLRAEWSLQRGHHLLNTNPAKATGYLTEAVAGFRHMDATERLWFAITLQREAFLLLNDWEGYVGITQQYDSLQEVLFNKQQQGILAEMEAKYETEKKEHQLQYERLLNERLVVFLVLLVAGLVVLAILWRRNARQKKELAVQNKVVEALNKEIHHRAMNHFSLIQSYYALWADDPPVDSDEPSPRQIALMLESMVAMYDGLNTKGMAETQVPFGVYMEPVLRSFSEAFQLSTSVIQLDGAGTLVSPDQLPYLGIIVIELLTNSIKHADTQGEPLRLRVACAKVGVRGRQVHMHDNGKGKPMNLHTKSEKSFGLRTVYLLAEKQLKGKIEWKHKGGLSWCLTFPNKL